MLTVITQDQENIYRIRYFHLKQDLLTGYYKMIGFDDETKELVVLGEYNFYRQAIDVFGKMDYQDNDLFYFKTNKKLFTMPTNITDERECIKIYGRTY